MGSASFALDGIPETMLWTLHNRAAEALRVDSKLNDPDCVRMYQAIDYDYVRSFGQPDYSHASRSLVFDNQTRQWMEQHPKGAVVELGAGLETSFQRINDDSVQWYCVDVPDAIDIRQRFLPETDRQRYVSKSALDISWVDAIDPGVDDVFISAQGLFMYFEKTEVRELIQIVCEKFSQTTWLFDVIPPWLSQMTMRGLNKTPHYVTPPMPWGIRRSEIVSTILQWSPYIHQVDLMNYPIIRFPAQSSFILSRLPILRNYTPQIVRACSEQVRSV